MLMRLRGRLGILAGYKNNMALDIHQPGITHALLIRFLKSIVNVSHYYCQSRTHCYKYSNQIVYSTGAKWHNLRHYRWYWIFNCKLYCPHSVALFRYIAYLTKIVENWWCPFDHDKKSEYQEGAIDKSYWHLHEQEKARLNPDDRDNPIWNEDKDKK